LLLLRLRPVRAIAVIQDITMDIIGTSIAMPIGTTVAPIGTVRTEPSWQERRWA
jgi:hypothetical protein